MCLLIDIWRDLGSGCCDGPPNNLVNENVGNLDDCKEKCLGLDDCNYIEHGWQDPIDSQWCVAKQECKIPLKKGPTHCGLGGDNGVHTYKLVSGS